MSTSPPVRPGGIVRVLCDTTGGIRVTADITAEDVKRLNCGCWAVTGTRPGPDMGQYTCRQIEILIRGCTRYHDDGSADEPGGMTVPAPVVIRPGPEQEGTPDAHLG